MHIRLLHALAAYIGSLAFTGTASEDAFTPLTPFARFDSPQIDESSGIVKSRQFPNVFWTHNDSGDRARIFPVDGDGHLLKPEWFKGDYQGIEVGHAVNIDWEDIATDNNGKLYIAACGNNANARRDLAVYVVPEPNPTTAAQTRAIKTIPFAYPDQEAFPPAKLNFDCEALFWANGKLYFLSKNRSDDRTKLYTLDSERIDQVNTLTLLSDFETGSQVTGAEATPDGQRLAVLCYRDIWIFEKPEDSENYLARPARHLRISAKQCEAISWIDEQTLLITNEQQNLYRISLDAIPKIANETK